MIANMLHPVNWVSNPNDPPKLAILSKTVYLTVSTSTLTSGVTKCKLTTINPCCFSDACLPLKTYC